MALQFLGREWIEAARHRVEASVDFAAAAKGLSATIVSVVTDTPSGDTIYLYYRFEDGKLKEVMSGTDAKMIDRTFDLKATGTYETFRLINEGELTAMKAFFQRKLKLEGNLLRAFQYVRPLDAYNRAVRDVPTEY